MHPTLERDGRVAKSPPTSLIVLTALAAPGAVLVEWLIHSRFETASLVELRSLIGEQMTVIAWCLCGAVPIASLVALFMARAVLRRKLERLGERSAIASERERVGTGVFLLAGSVPQIPAVLAGVLYQLGASLEPVFVAAFVSALGVFFVSRVVRRWSGSATSAAPLRA